MNKMYYKISSTLTMNKSTLILYCLLIFIVCFASAQDKIILTKGDTLKVSILEVSESNVTYRHYNEPEGAKYSTAKEKISKIIFASGRQEVIEKPAEKTNRWTNLDVKTYEDIQITYVPDDIEGMQALGQVFGEGGGLTNELASKQALRRLKRKAFKLGAKVIYISISTSNYFGTWNFQGTAYK
jgi:hypothetical protein